MKKNGFTLIELMIVIAILGILASIAIPSYQKSVIKSRRSDAQVALVSFANAMERNLTINNDFCNAGGAGGGDTCGDGAPNDTGTPTNFPTTSPSGGGTAYYNLTISAATANSYTLLATPINGQGGDGILTLMHTGVRAWDKNDDGDTTDSGENIWD